jgi:threonine synthase
VPSFLNHLELSGTGERFPVDRPINNPASDGRLLECRYDLDRLRGEVPRESIARGPASLWRYAPLLPVADPAGAVTLGEGFTPLHPAPRLAARLGMAALHVKDEGSNPSGTFKDRGATVAVSRYRELGVRTVAMNSSGNAGGSWSLYCARGGVRFVTLLPPDAQASTRAQTDLSGGITYLLPEWHAAGRIVREASERNGWLDVNTLKEPYRTEGKKTMGLEIAEQLGWRFPDALVYPMGGGLGAVAIYKAFEELLALGWVTGTIPKLFVTQYDGCAPVVKAFDEGREVCEAWGEIDILPGGLKSPNPVGGRRVLELMRRYGGAAIGVSRQEALAAVRELAGSEGIFACPEGATTVAGLRKALARGLIDRAAAVVCINTGTGLKSVPLFPPEPAPTIASAGDIPAR